MERYEISAKKSKVYTWAEAKALMRKGKVMCGEHKGGGPIAFYKIDEYRHIYYTTDFENDWCPSEYRTEEYTELWWYRAKEVIDEPAKLPKGVHKMITAIECAEFNTAIEIVFKLPYTGGKASRPLKCMHQHISMFTDRIIIKKRSNSNPITVWLDDLLSVVVGHKEITKPKKTDAYDVLGSDDMKVLSKWLNSKKIHHISKLHNSKRSFSDPEYVKASAAIAMIEGTLRTIEKIENGNKP